MPWPEAFLGEVALRRGEADRAGERFEHAYTLGCQVGDPCWESVALRGRGLLAAARAIHASPTPWPRRRLVGPCDGSLKLVPGLVIRRCG